LTSCSRSSHPKQAAAITHFLNVPIHHPVTKVPFEHDSIEIDGAEQYGSGPINSLGRRSAQNRHLRSVNRDSALAQ